MEKALKFRLAPVCLIVMLMLLGTAQGALANTAANTAIVNSARLTYSGGSASATVTVTVSLVPSTPNVTITNASGGYTAPDSPSVTDSVIIASTANGPADYTVTPSISSSTNDSGATVNIGGSPNTTVTIGASVTTGTSGVTYVTVPASGASGSNATVNGIGAGSTIKFTVNSNTYTEQVISTTDNGDGTFKITWAGGSAIPAADIPPAGTQVGEVKTVNVTVKPGTATTLGSNVTVTVQAVVSTTGAASATATNATANTWTSTLPNVTMTKYVRNVTTGAAGNAGATSFTINSSTNTYYTSGVIGKPGDTLEYVIQASNAAGSADLTGCAISDALPTSYVNFKSGDFGGFDVFYIDPTGATFKFTAAAVGANQASYVAPNLVVNVGTGANASSTGVLSASKNVVVSYRVTIK